MASRSERFLSKARSFEAKGRRDKALELYRDACREEPYDPDVWRARAETATAEGLHGEAAEAFFHVGDLYARGGLPAEALPVVKRVLEIDPGHGGARRLAGVLERRMALASGSLPAEPVDTMPELTRPIPLQQPPDQDSSIPISFDDADDALEAEIVEILPAPPVAPARRMPTSPIPPVPARVSATVPPIFSVHAEPPGGRALEDISLAERFPVSAVGAGGSDIPLDDDGRVDVVQAVASTLTTSPLLSELDSDLVRHLIDCGRLVHRTAEDSVFAQGDLGTSLYLVLSGEVAVRLDGRRELARLRPGAFFGEMALLTDMPRTASVVALRNSDFLEISRRAVRELIDRDPRVLKLLMRFFRARLVGTLLQTSELFAPLSRNERRGLVARFRLRELAADHTVIPEGGHGEGLFVVLVGRLDVLKSVASARVVSGAEPSSGLPGQSIARLLGSLGPGAVFGEMSLLDDAPAMATVRTRTRSWVLVLPRAEFVEAVARHPQVREQLEALAAKRRDENRATAEELDPGEHRVEPV